MWAGYRMTHAKELRTLKDIDFEDELDAGHLIENKAIYKILKAEAVKWVKELEKRWQIKPSNVEPFQIEWIKHFFNITEEDLQEEKQDVITR